MENRARNESDGQAEAEPRPWIMLIATAGAFGGAFAVFGVATWGPPAAVALVIAWALFLYVIALRQDRRDTIAGRIPFVGQQRRSRVAQGLEGLFLLSGLGCFGYGMWLERQGAVDEVSRPWSDGGFLLLPLGLFVGWTADMVIRRNARRRSSPPSA